MKDMQAAKLGVSLTAFATLLVAIAVASAAGWAAGVCVIAVYLFVVGIIVFATSVTPSRDGRY
jgi:hypothetical protein